MTRESLKRKTKKKKKKSNQRSRVNLIQKTSAVVPVEDAGEPPRPIFEGLDVHDLDEEQVARLRTLHLEGPAEIVYSFQVDVEDVVGRVIVTDLTAGPVRKRKRSVRDW